MIAALICNCPNAPTKVYKFLEKHVENWMDVPMYRGRKNVGKFLEQFSDYPQGDKSPEELLRFLPSVSKYIIIAGWDSNVFQWADIAHGLAQGEVDAEIIIRRFAGIECL